MRSKFTIVFAYRNRDSIRVINSLNSLKHQKNKCFDVVFIDYGSKGKYSRIIKEAVSAFDFVVYHYVGHEGLLWNKSKAVNYGVFKSKTDYIFIADVDVVFSLDFSKSILNLLSLNQYTLFKIGYLSEKVSLKQIKNKSFLSLKPKHYDYTFGVGLFSKKGFIEVGGLDEFFHFYGSEDMDLNSRLNQAGYSLVKCDKNLLLHQWHERYPQNFREKLSVLPRLSNVQRLNQRHYLRRIERADKIDSQSLRGFNIYFRRDYQRLKNPSKLIELDNVAVKIIHFLNYELPLYDNEIVELTIRKSDYYNSLKYRTKKILNKQTQPYLSLKDINDLILKKIVFNYRDYNYSYKITEDLKQIIFVIDFKNLPIL